MRVQLGIRSFYEISVAHHGAPDAVAVAGFSLETSFDDGATWAPADVAPMGAAKLRATIESPEGTEFVSLQSAAWDDGGGRVEETVIRPTRSWRSPRTRSRPRTRPHQHPRHRSGTRYDGQALA